MADAHSMRSDASNEEARAASAQHEAESLRTRASDESYSELDRERFMSDAEKFETQEREHEAEVSRLNAAADEAEAEAGRVAEEEAERVARHEEELLHAAELVDELDES